MIDLLRRSRGLGIALVTLALTAGVALAAAGPATVHPALTGAHGPSASGEPEDSEAPESEAPEAPDGSARPDTHGALVSAAAQMSTPPGFANHGAFVSCVAHMHGATLTGFDWSSVTPAACNAAKPGNGGH